MRIDNIIMAPYHKRTWQEALSLSSSDEGRSLMVELTIGRKLASILDEGLVVLSDRHDVFNGNNAV